MSFGTLLVRSFFLNNFLSYGEIDIKAVLLDNIIAEKNIAGGDILATFKGEIYSEVLRMDTGLTVVTPRKVKEDEGTSKVIYLLHGITENNSNWGNNVPLTLLSQQYNVIFIMPEVQRSFYTDMKYGLNYFTYVSWELPEICKRLFNISSLREDTYVMGLSMGGYGALKCALKNPDKYCGCGAFSAPCDIEAIYKEYNQDTDMGRELTAGFGLDGELLEENNLYNIAKACNNSALKPRIFMTSGTEDWLHMMSEDFDKYIKTLNFDYVYEVWQGDHNWEFWERSLKMALEHFFEREEN